jgi:hypothetical protein
MALASYGPKRSDRGLVPSLGPASRPTAGPPRRTPQSAHGVERTRGTVSYAGVSAKRRHMHGRGQHTRPASLFGRAIGANQRVWRFSSPRQGRPAERAGGGTAAKAPDPGKALGFCERLAGADRASRTAPRGESDQAPPADRQRMNSASGSQDRCCDHPGPQPLWAAPMTGDCRSGDRSGVGFGFLILPEDMASSADAILVGRLDLRGCIEAVDQALILGRLTGRAIVLFRVGVRIAGWGGPSW